MEQLLEYTGVISGFLYLWLEIRQHKAMWVVGFLTSLVYVFVFFSAKIYADMGLNIYYVAMSIYGFLKWNRTEKDTPGDRLLYRRLTRPLYVGIASAILLLYAAIYYLLDQYTDSPIPTGDAFTTAVSIVATWMLARRMIAHWWLWAVVNSVSIYLYYLRGLYPTLILYLCYAILAVAGYFIWKKKGTQTDDTDV